MNRLLTLILTITSQQSKNIILQHSSLLFIWSTLFMFPHDLWPAPSIFLSALIWHFVSYSFRSPALLSTIVSTRPNVGLTPLSYSRDLTHQHCQLVRSKIDRNLITSPGTRFIDSSLWSYFYIYIYLINIRFNVRLDWNKMYSVWNKNKINLVRFCSYLQIKI